MSARPVIFATPTERRIGRTILVLLGLAVAGYVLLTFGLPGIAGLVLIGLAIDNAA